MAEIKEIYKKRIKEQLSHAGRKGTTYKQLFNKCKGRKPDNTAFARAVAEMKKDGMCRPQSSKTNLSTPES